MPYPTPDNEAERNEALRTYRIMDSAPEVAFDEIGELAAQICGCPVSYISFIEEDRFWFKSKYGLPADFKGCPREIAFCSVTVCGADLVLSPDLAADDRFRNFHFVVNDPHFRFYCAMPLITPDGYALGTICVMDFEPREISFEQQETLRRLAHQLVGLLEHRRRIIELDEAMHELDKAHTELATEKSRAEELLYRILPEPIARELREEGKVQPRFFSSATVLLADISGFTRLTERTEPATLIAMLDDYFAAFDDIVSKAGLEKIKTIGDAYLAIAGVPRESRRHVIDSCLAAIGIREVVTRLRRERERLRLPFFEVRIGLHTGPMIAGVVGRHRFTYDVWGDAVNVASRLEAVCEVGRINVSDAVYHHAKEFFEFEARGKLESKGIEPMPMHYLTRIRAKYAADSDGLVPSDQLLALRASGDNLLARR